MSIVRLLGDGYSDPVDGHDVGAADALYMAEIPGAQGTHRHLTYVEAEGMLDSLVSNGWALVQIGPARGQSGGNDA